MKKNIVLLFIIAIILITSCATEYERRYESDEKEWNYKPVDFEGTWYIGNKLYMICESYNSTTQQLNCYYYETDGTKINATMTVSKYNDAIYIATWLTGNTVDYVFFNVGNLELIKTINGEFFSSKNEMIIVIK